jgi:hypothetical protein
MGLSSSIPLPQTIIAENRTVDKLAAQALGELALSTDPGTGTEELASEAVLR